MPGCLTYGETLEEALANFDDAKACWLDAAEEDYFVKVSPEYRAELDRIDAEMKNGEYITEEDFWE